LDALWYMDHWTFATSWLLLPIHAY
jgi:hypothetical protein